MKRHWPEYLIEAAGLGLFMVSASLFATVLWHPGSPVASWVSDGLPRRAFMGVAMAATALALVYNRWGKQSGAHYNPALTLTFLHLGRIGTRDALAYVAAQFAGGALGMAIAAATLTPWIRHQSVNFVMTLPGPWGRGAAWAAEFAMAFVLMTVVLTVSRSPRLGRFTGCFAALCVFMFIALESPVSGMSLNPARTLASAISGGDTSGLWIYFTAPICGMLTAAQAFLRLAGASPNDCAKLHHQNSRRCIFCESRMAPVHAQPLGPALTSKPTPDAGRPDIAAHGSHTCNRCAHS